jgi:hypothetical protein
LALVGWGVALALFVALKRHTCPIEPPTKAVLVNKAGLPESIRTLRGAPRETYSRAHGKDPAWIYHRVGTAAVYQTDAE